MQNCDHSSRSIEIIKKSQVDNNPQYYTYRHQPQIINTNLKNLQSLKNRISQLQSVLTYQYRKNSCARSQNDDSKNLSTEKSSYSLKNDRQRFFNQYQHFNESSDYCLFDGMPYQKPNNKEQSYLNTNKEKRSFSSKIVISKVQEQVLSLNNKKKTSILKQSTKSILQECLTQNLHEKILFLEQVKNQKFQKIRQDYKNQKKQIEQECQNQIQNQIQYFQKQIEKLNQTKNKESFSQSPLKTNIKPYLKFGIMKPRDQQNLEYKNKIPKNMKVRFQNTEIQKYKTEYN